VALRMTIYDNRRPPQDARLGQGNPGGYGAGERTATSEFR
jgi:hypothetical protein